MGTMRGLGRSNQQIGESDVPSSIRGYRDIYHCGVHRYWTNQRFALDRRTMLHQPTGDPMTEQVKKIFVVQGSTGEYSDRTEWNVAAYAAKEMAERHVLLVQQWLADEIKGRDYWSMNWDEREALTQRNPYDSHMSFDYSGTSYWVAEVDFRNTIPGDGSPVVTDQSNEEASA